MKETGKIQGLALDDRAATELKRGPGCVVREIVPSCRRVGTTTCRILNPS